MESPGRPFHRIPARSGLSQWDLDSSNKDWQNRGGDGKCEGSGKGAGRPRCRESLAFPALATVLVRPAHVSAPKSGKGSSRALLRGCELEAPWTECAVHRLERWGSNGHNHSVMLHPGWLFFVFYCLVFIIADGVALFLPWEIINEEASLELVYLWERGSLLLQSRLAHSLLEEVNYYTWKINYAL